MTDHDQSFEAPGSSLASEDDLGAPKSVPVPDGAPGTPQAAGKANGAAGEVPRAVKRKGGRPRGLGKVPGSGRRKTLPEPTGRAGREYLAKHSGCLDLLCRILSGKAIRMSGPTGKKLWYYPTIDDVRWAAGLAFPRLVPALIAQELSGPEGEPIAITDAQPLDMRETARRLALIFTRGDPARDLSLAGTATARADQRHVSEARRPRTGKCQQAYP